MYIALAAGDVCDIPLRLDRFIDDEIFQTESGQKALFSPQKCK